MTHLNSRTRRKMEHVWAVLKWRSYQSDPVAFFRDILWVERPGTRLGRVPFDLFDYQIEDLAVIRGNRRVVILKARQLGYTSLVMAYAFWHLLFNPSASVVLVSKDRDTAEEALEKTFDFFWRWMPEWTHDVRPVLEVDNAGEHVFRFPSGARSRIVSHAPTKTAGSGETASLVLWDEAALPDEKTPGIGDSIYGSLNPLTDTTDGQFIVFSTARGGHNRFARLYKGAKMGTSEFVAIFRPWSTSKFIDLTSYEAKKADFAAEPWKFYAEYPSTDEEAFRMSGRQRFPDLPPVEEFDDLPWRGRLSPSPLGEIELVPDEHGPLRLSAKLAANRRIPAWAKAAIGFDPAGGEGGDFTAMTGGWVGREGTPEIHAYWHANDIEPAEAARHADLLGRLMTGGDKRPALLAVEKQGGYGDTPLYILVNDLRYRNLYVHHKTGHRKHAREMVYGMPMTASKRPLVINTLASWLRYDIDDLPKLAGVFPLLRHELGAFVVSSDGIPRADVGMNDDLVMATAIWVHVLFEQLGPPAPATEAPRDEKPSEFVMSIGDLYEEAERASRRTDTSAERRFARSLTQGTHGNRRR